jgi:hypothetical protein
LPILSFVVGLLGAILDDHFENWGIDAIGYKTLAHLPVLYMKKNWT